VSAEETQRRTVEHSDHKRALQGLMNEWERLSQSLDD
jgi:hypothetical protein